MDERVSLVSEIVSAMRVVKMYCWETPLGEKVHNIRQTQLKYIWYVAQKSGMPGVYLIKTQLKCA